jgi:hypothetical protein
MTAYKTNKEQTMTQKPFTPNATEKVEKMTEAATAVLTAIQALEAAQTHAENWAEWETLGYFKRQLSEFMSCDHGEAGFEPYLTKESEKVFKGKFNPIQAAQKQAKVYNQKGQAIKVTIPA